MIRCIRNSVLNNRRQHNAKKGYIAHGVTFLFDHDKLHVALEEVLQQNDPPELVGTVKSVALASNATCFDSPEAA